MPTLTIKNVPEDLHERLKERAQRHRRSMNSEVLWILERVLTPSRPSAEDVIAEAKALNRTVDADFDAAFIDKDRRREGLQ